jgi:cysteine dioxygenase
MKMLSGTLKETQFHWPEQDESTSLREKASTLISTNEVTYINDTIGLHRIENPSHVDPAVSLHLYCPPIKVCHSYDERTGTSKECQVTFHNN